MRIICYYKIFIFFNPLDSNNLQKKFLQDPGITVLVILIMCFLFLFFNKTNDIFSKQLIKY
jgi:hypothetical protein